MLHVFLAWIHNFGICTNTLCSVHVEETREEKVLRTLPLLNMERIWITYFGEQSRWDTSLIFLSSQHLIWKKKKKKLKGWWGVLGEIGQAYFIETGDPDSYEIWNVLWPKIGFFDPKNFW